ncbi:MAG: lycopene cyclase domain-containing protein [Actinomycetes bacterium]
MERYSYLAVLAAVLLGSLWLEVVARTRVLRRARRLVLSIAPVLLVFAVWDAYAIDSGHWTFDAGHVLGLEPIAGVPIEELLFFVVVPLASILTLEAVRSVRGWSVGDEPRPKRQSPSP